MFVIKLPLKVTSPVSGSMVPVKSLAATGTRCAVTGIGFVIATSNGSKVTFACGNEMTPAEVTVPVPVPSSGENDPSPVTRLPS